MDKEREVVGIIANIEARRSRSGNTYYMLTLQEDGRRLRVFHQHLLSGIVVSSPVKATEYLENGYYSVQRLLLHYPEWNLPAIAISLNALVAPAYHPAWGTGQELCIGEYPQTTKMTLFPGHKVFDIQTIDWSATFHRMEPIIAQGYLLWISNRQDTEYQIWVNAAGSVRVEYAPPKAEYLANGMPR